MNKTEGFFSAFVNVTTGVTSLLKSPVAIAGAAYGSLFLNYYGKYHMFIEALLVCILADSIFGVWLAYKKKLFEWVKAVKILEKMVVYGFYLLIIHFVSRIEYIQQYGDWVGYFTNFIYTLMILNEGRSAFKNGNEVYPNKIFGVVVKAFDLIEGKAKGAIN